MYYYYECRFELAAFFFFHVDNLQNTLSPMESVHHIPWLWALCMEEKKNFAVEDLPKYDYQILPNNAKIRLPNCQKTVNT